MSWVIIQDVPFSICYTGSPSWYKMKMNILASLLFLTSDKAISGIIYSFYELGKIFSYNYLNSVSSRCAHGKLSLA